MTNDQLKIVEYEQAKDLLSYFTEKVEAGEIMSLTIVSELTDGNMCGGTTDTQNQYAVAGYMLAWALRRLGFVDHGDVRMMMEAGNL